MDPETNNIFVFDNYTNDIILHEAVHCLFNRLGSWPVFQIREAVADAFHEDVYYKRLLSANGEESKCLYDSLFMFDSSEIHIMAAGLFVKFLINRYGLAIAHKLYKSSYDGIIDFLNKNNFDVYSLIENCLNEYKSY